MDAACGTKSLLLQFCPDFDECLYCGDEVLTKRFLSDGGLKIVNVEDMMSKCELINEMNTSVHFPKINMYTSLGPNHKLWIGEPEPDTGSVSKRTPKCICSIAEKYLLK